MEILIGTIKHCERERIDVWARSASIFCKTAKKVLICLDEVVPDSILSIRDLDFEVVHSPTPAQTNIDIMKFERHYVTQKYLESIQERNAIVLVTDTLDVVFQSDPFAWYRSNKSNKLLLGSEGIQIQQEFWNHGVVSKHFLHYVENIKANDVFCAGVIMGEIDIVEELMFYIFNFTKKTKSEDSEGVDQGAMQVILNSRFFKESLQKTTTSEAFVVHCAVAGPTEQFVSWGFERNYKYDLPSFNGELVVNKNNEPYCLVHQYNRVREWNEFFRAKYKYRPYVDTAENTAIVVCTKTTSSHHNDWKKAFRLGNHDYMLCNVQPDTVIDPNALLGYVQDNIINYSTDNLREALNFYAEPSDRHRWNVGGGRNIVWFYPHFRMMYFYKLFPEYEHYWFFDDDVTFPQNELYEFINAHKDLDHDCMISYLFSDLNAENPSRVLEMEETMGSYHSQDHNWLTHYPGAGDVQPTDVREKYGSYFPLVRLSNRALKTLVEEHERGYYGYSEGYVPTILNYRGLKLYSIYNKQSKVAAAEDITVYHRGYLDLVWKNV